MKNSHKHGYMVNCFVQARMTSTRLPNKIYRDINGMPLLFRVLSKVNKARLIDKVIVASPHPLTSLPEGQEQFIYSGPENDVLDRFYHCFLSYPCDYIVRVTADCPLLDPGLIDFVIDSGYGSDYCSNVFRPGFPDGVDVEMISADTLVQLHETATSAYDREHVTTFIRRPGEFQDKLKIVSVIPTKDYSDVKISVDTEDDLKRVTELTK